MNFLGQKEIWGLIPIRGAFQHLYGILEHDLQILLDLKSSKEKELYKINGRGSPSKPKWTLQSPLKMS